MSPNGAWRWLTARRWRSWAGEALEHLAECVQIADYELSPAHFHEAIVLHDLKSPADHLTDGTD